MEPDEPTFDTLQFLFKLFCKHPSKTTWAKDSSATQDWPNFPTFFLDPGDPGDPGGFTRHGTGPIARDRRRLRRSFGVQELLLGGRQLLPQGFHLTSEEQRPRVPHGGEAKSGENWLKNASEWLENSTWLMGTGDKSWKQLIKFDETAGTSKNIREIFRYDIMIWSENGGDHHYQKRLEVSSPCLAAPAGHCAPRFALHFALPGRWVGRNNLNC